MNPKRSARYSAVALISRISFPVMSFFAVGTAAPCGDVDNSGRIDVGDAVHLINFIFAGGPPSLDDAAGDLNCSGRTDITDAVYMINFIFVAGPEPCSNSECQVGVFLTGDPGANASTMTYDYGPFAADSQDVDSTGLLKTRLSAIIHPDATLGEVNVALAAVNGSISWMSIDDKFVTVKIPPVSSKNEADGIAAELVQSGAFLYAYPAHTVAASGGADISELPPTGDVEIGHLTRMRMPAAWNVKALAESVNNPSSVLIPDKYYTPIQYSEIPSQLFLLGRGRRELTPSWSGNHGFAVSGVIGARHDAVNATGVHPLHELLRINSVMLSGLTFVESFAEIARQFPSGRFVLNTSLGYNADFNETGKLSRMIEGMKWRAIAQPRQSDFFHSASAGNDGDNTDGSRYAVFGSAFNVAASFDLPFEAYSAGELGFVDSVILNYVWNDFVEDNPSLIVKLNNVMVVGSSNAAGAESPFSCSGAPIRVHGEEVAAPCVREDPANEQGACTQVTGNVFLSHYSGTSLAAPQISGLVAYMLNLEPLMTNNEIKNILYRSFDNSNEPGFVDAYLAVLDIDDNIGTASVRPVLLDIVNQSFDESPDGKFDEYDIQAFLAKFDEYEQIRLGVPDAPADYSRYDLNGDGYTGGNSYIARFDLDVNDPPQFTGLSIQTNNSTLQFDENTVVDLDILCYYARTSLFEGIDSLADELLVDCPCSQPFARNAQCVGCNSSITNLIGLTSRTGYIESEAGCSDCGCPTIDEQDSVPKLPADVFGVWSGNVDVSFTCAVANCAGSAQSSITSAPLFDTLSNRWVLTVTGDGTASAGGPSPPCYALSIALENWQIQISDSCQMKYTLHMSVGFGDMSFRGSNYDANQSIRVDVNYPGGDTTITGELSPGTLDFEYLVGMYTSGAGGSNNHSIEFIIEPADAQVARNSISIRPKSPSNPR